MNKRTPPPGEDIFKNWKFDGQTYDYGDKKNRFFIKNIQDDFKDAYWRIKNLERNMNDYFKDRMMKRDGDLHSFNISPQDWGRRDMKFAMRDPAYGDRMHRDHSLAQNGVRDYFKRVTT